MKKKKKKKTNNSLDARVYAGMNSREALRIARELGCKIHPVRRTGEVRVSHQKLKRSRKLSDPSRRKDATRPFTTWLKRLLRKV